MSGQTAQLVGQIQAQAEVQRQDARGKRLRKLRPLGEKRPSVWKFRPSVQKFRPSVQMLKLSGLKPNRGKRLRELKLGRERRC